MKTLFLPLFSLLLLASCTVDTVSQDELLQQELLSLSEASKGSTVSGSYEDDDDSYEDAQGIIIQTIPQNLKFEPYKKFKITFKYQAESDNYSFVLGDNRTILFENKVSQQHDTQVFEFIFTASQSGNSWFGIKKNNEETSDFILDDITIIEME